MWAGFKGWESICMCWCSSRVVHDSACVDLYWELGVYLHASSHFESRVCNFVCVCVCVWKSWLLLRWMLCIWGFACRCGMHLCVPSAELVSSFVTMYWERGMYARCVYLHVPALSVYLHAWRAWHFSACVSTYQELGVYLHASSHFESRVCNFVCVCVCVWKSWLLLRWMLCIWGFACRCGMHLCVPSAELVSSFVTMYWERGMYARCVYLHVPALSVYLHAWRAWHFSACDVPRAGRVSARVITFQTLCPYVIPVNVHAGEHRIEECLLVHKLHAYDYDGLDGVGDPLSLHVYGCALA